MFTRERTFGRRAETSKNVTPRKRYGVVKIIPGKGVKTNRGTSETEKCTREQTYVRICSKFLTQCTRRAVRIVSLKAFALT